MIVTITTIFGGNSVSRKYRDTIYDPRYSEYQESMLSWARAILALFSVCNQPPIERIGSQVN